MVNNEFIRAHAPEEKKFNAVTLSKANVDSVKLIEEKTDGEKLNAEKLEVVKTSDSTFFIYLLAIIGGLFLLRLLTSHKTVQNQIPASNAFNQIPCRQCRFFTNNHYLKCAVHPSNVLKQQAINCPDYWPPDGKFLN